MIISWNLNARTQHSCMWTKYCTTQTEQRSYTMKRRDTNIACHTRDANHHNCSVAICFTIHSTCTTEQRRDQLRLHIHNSDMNVLNQWPSATALQVQLQVQVQVGSQASDGYKARSILISPAATVFEECSVQWQIATFTECINCHSSVHKNRTEETTLSLCRQIITTLWKSPT